MSAYIVDKVHIDLMVSAAMDTNKGQSSYAFSYYNPFGIDNARRRHEVNLDTADQIGRMLLTENIRSVAFRYNDTDIDNLPGPIDATRPEDYVWVDHHIKLDPAEVAHLIGCYEYQTCEHDEWHTSDAQAFCHTLREEVLGNLPGRADSPWGWSQSDIDARTISLLNNDSSIRLVR